MGLAREPQESLAELRTRFESQLLVVTLYPSFSALGLRSFLLFPPGQLQGSLSQDEIPIAGLRSGIPSTNPFWGSRQGSTSDFCDVPPAPHSQQHQQGHLLSITQVARGAEVINNAALVSTQWQGPFILPGWSDGGHRSLITKRQWDPAAQPALPARRGSLRGTSSTYYVCVCLSAQICICVARQA